MTRRADGDATQRPRNVDQQVVAGFGDEWSRFDQRALSESEKQRIFDEYFAIFPWSVISPNSVGADFGSGSGRWASVVAPRVGRLLCVDASDAAIEVARKNLARANNCEFYVSSIEDAPIVDDSLDFAYCLGVLHHIPNTQSALNACVQRLKQGAPLLVYLYYRFDDRPGWYRAMWRVSDILRRIVSRMPHSLRYVVSQLLAAVVYWPMARIAAIAGSLNVAIEKWPLSYYSAKSFYVMRTDALDRFGTRLEKRYTRDELQRMLLEAGLTDVTFSTRAPYWCAVGFRAGSRS